MRTKIRGILTGLCLMGLLFANLATAEATSDLPPVQPMGTYVTTRAIDFGVLYWTNVVEPHYGAYFPGMNGRNPHFLGAGGDAATCASSSGCISNWGWWGDYYHVLQIPKGGWLWAQLPGGDRWQATSYQADMYIG